MKKLYKRAVILVLFISALSGFCSCRLEDSYKEFVVKNITGNSAEDFFASDKYDFAKAGNVMLEPEIREINHGVYIIYISAYSETGTENIIVKNIFLKGDKDESVSLDVNKKIQLEENEDDIYSGWIEGGTFKDEEIEAADSKELVLIIQVESTKNDVAISKKITFEIVIKIGKTFVLPT